MLLKNAMACISQLKSIPYKENSYKVSDLRNYEKSIAFCNNNKLSIDPILSACNIAESLPSFFAHADLHLNNISSDGIIYDWDSSGYFPAGYDLAGIICETKLYDSTDISKFIENHYDENNLRLNTKNLTISTLLLAFLMISGRKTKEKKLLHTELEKYLTKNKQEN